MSELDCLRVIVRDCLDKNLISSASFLADKLACLSSQDPEDVLLLARCYYGSRQFRRALRLLRAEDLVHSDTRFRLLAAKCLEQVKEWEECLALLEDANNTGAAAAGKSWPGFPVTPVPGGGFLTPSDALAPTRLDLSTPTFGGASEDSPRNGIKPAAAFNLIRGRAYEALGNRPKAIHWLSAALQADPFCSEAFDELMENHMLTTEQEVDLVESLNIPAGFEWLRLLYSCRCKKYGREDAVEQQLKLLEGPSPLSNQPTRQGNRRISARPTSTSSQAPTPAAVASVAAAAATGGGDPANDTGQGVSDIGKKAGVGLGLGWASKDGGGGAGGGGGGGRGRARTVEQGLLGGSGDVATSRAELMLHVGRYEDAYRITKHVLDRDPHNTRCIPTHLVAAVHLGRRNELFRAAHQLVDDHPNTALAWFAVACYYYCIRQHDQARRFFCKATTVSAAFAPAWMGFGHTYAAQEETDQAMVAYRTAVRLFTGFHVPLVCIGMEYARSNNLSLSLHFLDEARRLCPSDPLVHNELGVIAYRSLDFTSAARHFEVALRLVAGYGAAAGEGGGAEIEGARGSSNAAAGRQAVVAESLGLWESTVVNLGHSYRKMRRYGDALMVYEQALSLRPNTASTFSAMAFTHHLQGNLIPAIECYHKALGLCPGDSLSAEMLGQALKDECALMSTAADDHVGPVAVLPPLNA
ncbi:unnamed protein product [Closterium sp. NIES-53]